MNLLLTDPTNALIQCYLFQTVNYLSSSKYTMTHKALSRSAISALQIVWYHLLRPINSFQSTAWPCRTKFLTTLQFSYILPNVKCLSRLCHYHTPIPLLQKAKKRHSFLIHQTNTKWKEYISMKQGKVTFFGF